MDGKQQQAASNNVPREGIRRNERYLLVSIAAAGAASGTTDRHAPFQHEFAGTTRRTNAGLDSGFWRKGDAGEDRFAIEHGEVDDSRFKLRDPPDPGHRRNHRDSESKDRQG